MAVTYSIDEENSRVFLYGPPTWAGANPYAFEFSWFQEVEDYSGMGPSWLVKHATQEKSESLRDVYAALAVARDELVERGLIKENISWRPAASPTR